MYLIYCHTRENMRYIGYTKQTMTRRWDGHVSCAFKGGEQDFMKAIREHGPDAFTHEVILDGIETLKEAKSFERYYIKELNTQKPNGYNMTKGGNGSGPKSEATRQLISQRTREGMVLADPSWKQRQREAMSRPEVRETISKRTSEAMYESERYAKFVEQMSSDERRKMVSERTMEAMQRPEVHEKQLAGLQSVEGRANIKAAHTNPAYRQKQSQTARANMTDERKQLIKERTRAAMQQPDVKERLAARKKRPG